jgi:hypothetical protein
MRAFATPRGLRGDLPTPSPTSYCAMVSTSLPPRCQGALQHWQGARAKADRMVLRLDGAADPPPFRK